MLIRDTPDVTPSHKCHTDTGRSVNGYPAAACCSAGAHALIRMDVLKWRPVWGLRYVARRMNDPDLREVTCSLCSKTEGAHI